jgi:hypothetical protein
MQPHAALSPIYLLQRVNCIIAGIPSTDRTKKYAVIKLKLSTFEPFLLDFGILRGLHHYCGKEEGPFHNQLTTLCEHIKEKELAYFQQPETAQRVSCFWINI